MSADPGGLRSSPLEEIFRTRTGLLLLTLVVVAGACLALASAMQAGTARTFIEAVGTGTLISAVVGFGQTMLTANATRRALVAPVIEESKRTLQELSSEYRALNNEFFPTHIFAASSRPDPTFNQLMMRDLRETRQYFFRGFSGRHAAARLLLSQAEREIHVVIADPRVNTGAGGRARYLLRHEGADADSDAVRRQLRDETWIGLVGLYLARNRCAGVEITVLADPPLDRVEMFDGSVWVTLYSDPGQGRTLYPRTLRFSEGSFIYGMERAEFLRLGTSGTERHFRLTPASTRSDFIGVFEEITGNALADEQFHQLRDRFHTFRQKFTVAAELGS
ncbi:hypothetical protein SAMN05216266_106136 [Amycolatopsis marina]|uniref:Uncharacterized protein n=1 Tax=Amycolatopsis marina TaxID=490629 RepID=A0A1I0Z947_9PSEU|nr:hypothetical protein [Amycolatopsis marina]SFB20958.1 hypothetical protein SAMN05216266_106136 [Amycolatopsis marina]